MSPADFSLSDYKFDQILIDLEKRTTQQLNVEFDPKGVFYSKDNEYELEFVFTASDQNNQDPFIKIRCIARFKFRDSLSFSDIPDYFYNNSIAILFPYVRAFVSNVTLQTNTKAIMIPTWNLSSLKSALKTNTTEG